MSKKKPIKLYKCEDCGYDTLNATRQCEDCRNKAIDALIDEENGQPSDDSLAWREQRNSDSATIDRLTRAGDQKGLAEFYNSLDD